MNSEAVAKPPFPFGRAALCRGRGRDGARPSRGFATATSEKPELYLKRKFDAFLLDWKTLDRHFPLIVKGARQVGKTVCVRHFAEGRYDSFVEINFVERPEFKVIVRDGYSEEAIIRNISQIDPSFRFVIGKTLIFFDEIQEFPEIATAFKFFAQKGHYDVIASGSLLGVHYRRIESLSVGYQRSVELRSKRRRTFACVGISGHGKEDCSRMSLRRRLSSPAWISPTSRRTIQRSKWIFPQVRRRSRPAGGQKRECEGKVAANADRVRTLSHYPLGHEIDPWQRWIRESRILHAAVVRFHAWATRKGRDLPATNSNLKKRKMKELLKTVCVAWLVGTALAWPASSAPDRKPWLVVNKEV